MYKKFILLSISLMFFLPFVVKAEDTSLSQEDSVVVTKYYKTTTYHNNASLNNTVSGSKSITEEISKSEYDNVDVLVQPQGSATIEFNYRKLVSTITKVDNYYRYKADVTWKTMPKVKSYDIIGIGFYASVKVLDNDLFFTQEYCTSNGICYNSSLNHPQIFASGAGTSFPLPDTKFVSLRQTLYFDVEKNTTATILAQLAASDYAHAESTISKTNSMRYSVGGNGISLNGVYSYYDDASPAEATWSGSW